MFAEFELLLHTLGLGEKYQLLFLVVAPVS